MAMAVSPFFTKCKWKTRTFINLSFSLSQSSSISSSQVRKAEECKAIEKADATDESNKLGLFAYKICQITSDSKHINTEASFLINSNKPAKSINLRRKASAPSSSVEDLWKNFFADPSKWFDNRKTKKDNKSPDFKHKCTREVLWLNDKTAPAWVLLKLNDLQSEAFAHSSSKEDMWKIFFSDPSKWIDYRKTKKSNKHPDFVHKDNTQILWIDGWETPSWVAPMVKKLHDKAFACSPSTENLWKTFFDDPSEWFDNRKIKKSSMHPDFKRRDNGEALWIDDCDTPAWVFLKLNDLRDEAFLSFQFMEDLWKTFYAEPSKWLDFRKHKKNNKSPDFMHKENGKVLWIQNSKTPAWVLAKLNDLQVEKISSSASMEELWKTFFSDPSKWIDYRKRKKSNRCPDFVHGETTEGLWVVAIGTPCWIIPMLKELRDEVFAPSAKCLWITFLDNPSNWFDDRKIKKSSKHPDFKHKDNGEALWIRNDRTPSWVLSMLNDMPNEAFAPSKPTEDLWETFFADPLKWLDYRKTKENNKFPDFRHKVTREALWIGDTRTPAWVLPKLNELQHESFVHSQATEELWISVFVDQSKWLDYSKTKKNNNHPDFINKDTHEALWINDIKTPAWVTPILKDLKNEAFAPLPSLENPWKSLFNDPSKWFDNRKIKKNSKYPDFKHKDTYEALWINDTRTPDWVFQKLDCLHFKETLCPDELTALNEAKWKVFFASPSKWFDNRPSKSNPNAPDFIHKDTNEGLWITKKWTPDWVVSSLSQLQNELL